MGSQVETPAELAGSTYTTEITNKAAELKQALIDQTLQDLDSFGDAMDAEFKKQYPKAIGSWTAANQQEIETYKASVRNDYYSWVEPAFADYLLPDPDATNSMIASLRSIESTFGGSQDDAGNFSPSSPALGRINDARSDMNNWEGDLKTNFIDNYLTPLQTVSLNQGALAKVVREQLECNKIMYIRYRKGILNLVHDSIEAVKTLDNGRDPKSFTWGTLIGIAAGTALTAFTGGLAIAGVVLIMGSTIAQGLVPEPPKTNELSAPTAQEVAVKISEAMSKMNTDIAVEEEKVETAFKAILDTVTTARANAIAGNTFGPLTAANPKLNTEDPGKITDGSLRPKD